MRCPYLLHSRKKLPWDYLPFKTEILTIFMFFSWVRRMLSGHKSTESRIPGEKVSLCGVALRVRTSRNGGGDSCGNSRKGTGIQLLDQLFYFTYFSEGLLIYNIVLVSGVRQWFCYSYMCIYSFQILFPDRFLQNIEYSSLIGNRSFLVKEKHASLHLYYMINFSLSWMIGWLSP